MHSGNGQYDCFRNKGYNAGTGMQLLATAKYRYKRRELFEIMFSIKPINNENTFLLLTYSTIDFEESNSLQKNQKEPETIYPSNCTKHQA